MNTTLLIMAAGIGSRFGTGIKQLEPVDDARKVSLKIDDYLFGVLGMDTEQASNEKRELIKDKGNCLLCNNNSHIANHTLRNIMRMIEARHDDVIQAWIQYFGEIRYFC